MRPGENQNYRGMSPLGEEGSLEARPILDTPAMAPSPVQPVTAPATPQTLLHLNKWAVIATGALLALIVVVGFVMLWSVGFKSNQQSNQPASKYEDKNLALDDVSQNDLLQVSQAAKLSINGELQVGSTFILTPTDTPTSPKVGQIYYDKTTNTPYVYDGTSFKSMVDLPAVQSLGGITGAITLGNGLQLSGSQLTVSAALQQSIGARVTTIQGQSGDVNLVSGNGISVNGTTITNTGVVQINGTNGLSVTQANGTVTLGLPQLLGTLNSPTFASVQLSNALGVSSGGTGLADGDLDANSVMITSAAGGSYELVAPSAGGQCLISDSLDNGKIKFGSCTGTTSNGVNGITDGAGNTVDTDVILRPASGSPLTVTANVSTNIIELGVAAASNTAAGIVTTTTQTFAGAKTFNGGLTVATGQNLRLGTVCTTGQVLTTNASGDIECTADNDGGVDNDTTYSAGDGLNLGVGNVFSLKVNSGWGLEIDTTNGLQLLDDCATNEVLKRTASGWACGSDVVGGGDGNTTYTAGNGIDIDAGNSNAISIVLQGTNGAGSGLQLDSSGLALAACDATNTILKWNNTLGIWECGVDAGSSGLGDDISVNGSAANNANFMNTTGTSTVAAITWNLNTTPNPNEISLTVAAASNTAAGIVTTTTQTFAGAKTFNGGLTVGTNLITTDIANSKVGINGAINTSDSAALQLVNGDFSLGSGRIYTSSSGINVRYNGNANEQNILYGGGTLAEGIVLQNVRIANNSTVKFGDDSAGVMYADANGFVKKLNTSGATNKCFGFDGTDFTWSTCGGVLYGDTNGDGTGTTYNATSIPKGRLATIDATGKLNASELSFAAGYLQYNGGAYALDLKNATASTLTVQNSTAGQVANLTVTGTITAPTINASTTLQVGGADINTAGTLSNVAYENQANVFTQANTFRNSTNSANAFRIQNASSVDVLNVNTTNQTINIGGSAKTYSSGTGYTYGSGYAARANYTIAGSYTTAYADFNGDGYKDYVRSNTAGNLISMMLNNGNATFASATSIATGLTSLGDIAAGDVDADGDQDIVVVRGTNVSVLKNNGTGTFAAATNYAAGSTLVQLTIFDVDNDGDKDVVGVSGAVDALVVLKNNGTGTLAAATTYPTFSDAYSAMVTFGDVDNDGDQDVALAVGGYASVFKNNGTGAFTVRNDYGSADTVALADVDNDGDKDLIVSGGSAMPGVRLNDGSGNFGTATNYSLTGNHYNQAVVGNLDDDANPDIAFTGMYMDVIGYGLVEGNGSGGVSSVTGLSDFYDGDSFTGTTDVDLVDLDVDGDDDLVFSLTDGTIRVHKNNYILGGSPVVSVSSTTSITASSSDKAALLLQGASGQSVDILRVQGSSVTPYFRVANSGKVGIGTISDLESSTYGLNVQGGAAIDGNINISAGSDYLIDGVSITTGGTLANVAYLDYDNEFTGVTNSFNSAATTGYALAVNADSATTGGALQVSTTSGQLLSGNFIDINQASQYANNYSTTNTLLNVSRTVGTQDITATISQIGSVSSGYSTSSASAGQQYFTFSHTVPNTGSNRVLFVALATCYNTMTVTYNGVAMTKYSTTGTNQTGNSCNGNDTGGYGTVAYYYLVNPSTGTNTVAVTTGSANSQYAGAIAMTFQNVNQTTPINNAATGNPATINVRSYEVGLDVYLGTAGGSYNPVPGGSQIMQGSVVGAGPFRMGASKTPVSGTTISQMSWTPVNSSIWDHMAIRLNPAVIPGVGSASGNLVSFTNSCDAGTCGDTTTLLNLNQTVAQSTGSVLNIQNAGTGYSLQVGGNTSIFSGQQNGYNAAAATLLVGRNSTTLRSINAAGAIGASGADYAEWIPWTGTKPEPGSVVVYKGSTFIVSSLETAAVVGNDKIDTDNAILVAFSGQLPVKVTGAVQEGDLLISNGDGTAKAVPAAEATLADYANRVAIAWETNLDPGVKKIIGAVGTSAAGLVNASALQGTGSFGSLNVTGNATIGGDLTVAGLTTVGNIAISGHIITTGGQPTDELQTAAGSGAIVVIDGNDTLGTITITTGSAPTAGAMAKVIFSELYSKAPRVVLSASDENAAGIRFYKGVTTADGFVLNFKDAPASNTTYTFDYFIGE